MKPNQIERIIRRVDRLPTLPIIYTKLTRLLEAPNTTVQTVGNIIAEDQAIAVKVLRLVNSAFYGHFAGKITTVSRAVVILGFEQVRLAATGLMLFEHLQNKAQSRELKDATVGSFMSGIIAGDAARAMGFENTEEAFISAMLHNLGKYLAIFYFPDEYNRIKNAVEQRGLEEETASRAVLGLTYEDLGIGVAKIWKFPEAPAIIA